MMNKGIDVSHHNGAIDWKAVRVGGVDFAMLRACYGWDNDKQIDRQLSANAAGCAAAGVPFGLYHYSYALTPEDARREAAFFLRVISGLRPEYPVAFDFEERAQLALTCGQQLAVIDAFMEGVQAAGYYAVLYMSASPLEALRRHTPDRLGKYDCWVAHVNVQKPAFSGEYGIWQYSWKGRVDGIAGDVDLNHGCKDYPSIIKAAGLNGWAVKPPAPGEERDYKAMYFDALERLDDMTARCKALRNGVLDVMEKYT